MATTYPHIRRYHADLRRLVEAGGSANELHTRRAFENCLDAYCREHSDGLTLVAEQRTAAQVVPDGTVRDALRMARGYWEAKDIQDDLDAVIQDKLSKGYPRDNIIFENTDKAALFQNGVETMRADMSSERELHRLIRRFLDYELPQIEEFRAAQRQFKADLPSVLGNLREAVEEAQLDNAGYQAAAAQFLALCQKSISPEVADADVREMLLQHILTKDIFLRVFAEDQFHRENNIAAQLDALERTFFTGDTRRQAIDRLRAYYGVIGRAADEIADYAEKQGFLKAVYEDFYKAYNPAAADRLGVVYTPNEVVDFIIRGADWLLQRHFGKTLADMGVQILDPATGTGTFVTNLINHLPADRLEYKYLNEIHANEVAILPYYIANLNIEYTYKERAGRYKEFPNLVFVDTLDNLDWEGATGGAVQRQGALELGGMSADNWVRLGLQNEKPISVIIGNPPYNDGATLWGDGGANRAYHEIDKRIRETYVAESSAQKTHQYDMYKRFIRWASDRLEDDGIIAFVSNNAFLDSRQDDGFRMVASYEFNELWAVNLKGNARTSGERRRQEGGNVFDDKIRVGVAVYFLVRRKRMHTFKMYYNAVDDYAKAADKLAYLRGRNITDLKFTEIIPDDKGNWLEKSNPDYERLLPLANQQTKFAKTLDEERAVFKLITPGVNTTRDEWVYDFDVSNLRNKALFFADKYAEMIDGGDISSSAIKWSHSLQDNLKRGERIVFNDAKRIRANYRPFVSKWQYAEPLMNDRLTRNHYEMFGADLKQPNSVINFCVNHKAFYALASDKLTDLHFTGDTQCLPLYRYTADGERVCNITDWAVEFINAHYRKDMGEYFEKAIGADAITAEDIFAYVYAVLHDPVYHYDYKVDLLREFPRIPLYSYFASWTKMGRKLLDLHLGFESVEPHPLERVEGECPAGRTLLRADKERGIIRIDERTTLAGVPANAWRYKLGSRSALEWVLEQYKERKARDATVAARFNGYRFADHKERVIDLLGRVCAVSDRTIYILDGMAYWDGKYLVVMAERDRLELTGMGLKSIFSFPKKDVPW